MISTLLLCERLVDASDARRTDESRRAELSCAIAMILVVQMIAEVGVESRYLPLSARGPGGYADIPFTERPAWRATGVNTATAQDEVKSSHPEGANPYRLWQQRRDGMCVPPASGGAPVNSRARDVPGDPRPNVRKPRGRRPLPVRSSHPLVGCRLPSMSGDRSGAVGDGQCGS